MENLLLLLIMDMLLKNKSLASITNDRESSKLGHKLGHSVQALNDRVINVLKSRETTREIIYTDSKGKTIWKKLTKY